jgi:predicted RecA/RadA family phage recombinase
MKNFVMSGELVDWTSDATVSSGDVILRGSLFGACTRSGVSGDVIPVRTGGVLDYAKNSAEAWTFGVKLYWDNTNKVFTTASAGNTAAGVAVAVAANPSSTGRVRLNPSF